MMLSVISESNVDRFNLLRGMLHAIAKGRNDSEKIAQINAFLFNNGAREFGSAGEQVKFDTTIHEIMGGSPLPGDMVMTVSSGYKDTESGYILKKAGVKQV